MTSTLDGGAITSQTVDVGGMTVAGQKFAYGPDGFTAVGKVTPIPGIPTSAADLLKTLGVAIEVPKPEITKNGPTGRSAEALGSPSTPRRCAPICRSCRLTTW